MNLFINIIILKIQTFLPVILTEYEIIHLLLCLLTIQQKFKH